MSLRAYLRKWTEIVEDLPTNPLTPFASILEQIDLTLSDALDYFTLHYESAATDYTDAAIITVFQSVYATNKLKYERALAAMLAEYDPLDNVNAVESYTETRTPNLSYGTTGSQTLSNSVTRSSQTSGTVKNNQTKTSTETPTNYTQTSINYEDPYDGTGFHQKTKDETVDSGSRATTEAYSGQPDQTSSTGSGSETATGSNSSTESRTETGTETTTRTSSRHGNIGGTASTSLIGWELDLSNRLNLFRIIERDIAEALFLGVWLPF